MKEVKIILIALIIIGLTGICCVWTGGSDIGQHYGREWREWKKTEAQPQPQATQAVVQAQPQPTEVPPVQAYLYEVKDVNGKETSQAFFTFNTGGKLRSDGILYIPEPGLFLLPTGGENCTINGKPVVNGITKMFPGSNPGAPYIIECGDLRELKFWIQVQ